MSRRSPIKEPPLRAPGQSLDERRLDILLDRLLFPSVTALFLTVFWLYDLWRSYHDVPPMPWISGILALAAIAYAAWQLRRALPSVRRLRLALDGERSVGQGLEQLRASGYSVYHDILGNDFNVDHVLVGPAGIFAIETKTWSKPLKDRATVLVDGESILVDGRVPLRDPVAQARAQSAWIAEVLKKSTGRDFPVTAVVVFPGWWIETKSKPKRLWVINDKMLAGFLAKEPVRLSADQLSMACFHLEAFIRTRMPEAYLEQCRVAQAHSGRARRLLFHCPSAWV